MGSSSKQDRAARLRRLREKQPTRAEYRVSLSHATFDAYQAAREAMAEARFDVETATDARRDETTAALARAREVLAKARAELDADCEVLTFEGLPRDVFRKLLADNPPTPTQIAEAKEHGTARPEFHPEKFPPALIAAACVDPGFESPEEVDETVEAWNESEREALFLTAYGVCRGMRIVPTDEL